MTWWGTIKWHRDLRRFDAQSPHWTKEDQVWRFVKNRQSTKAGHQRETQKKGTYYITTRWEHRFNGALHQIPEHTIWHKVFFFLFAMANQRKDNYITTDSTVHFNTGKQLQRVVKVSINQQGKVNLIAAPDPKDAHAIRIKYHLPCLVKNVQWLHQDSQTDLADE